MKKFLVLLVIAAMTLFSVSAFAYDVKVDDDTFAKVGAKAQIQYVMSTPVHDKVDVGVGNARLYVAGQVTNQFKFGLNFDMGRTATATLFEVTDPATGAVDVIAPSTQTNSLSDAFIILDLAKEFKIMTGIYRMAVSRVALQDSYQFILINSPEVASKAFLSNATLAGFRSGGLTLWGDLADGMVRYNVGLWDGDYMADKIGNLTTGVGTNPDDKMAMTARVVLNFMDPEKGYTCPGCYLGKAKVANVGVGYLTQDYMNTVAAAEKTYTVMTVDGFYDANGITAEAAYFQYDYDNGVKPTGYYAEAAYAMDKIQPAARYESFDADVAANDNTDFTKIVLGVNYLFAGHDAKIGIEYAMKDFDGTGVDVDTTTLQLQVQF
jgi:hypothetical protein